MSHSLTEVSEFTASVPVPDSGDKSYVTVVPAGFQAVANRTKYLKGVLDPLATLVNVDIAPRVDVLEEDMDDIHDLIVDGPSSTQSISLDSSGATRDNLVIPDTSLVNSSSPLRAPFIALQNNIGWLRARVPGAGVSQIITWAPQIVGGNPEGGAYWGYAVPTTAYSIYTPHVLQISADTERNVMIGMPALVPGIYIKQITARVASPVSHGGSLPEEMPAMGLVKYASNATLTTVASQVDTSASAAAFEAEHTISIILSEIVAQQWCYALFFKPEGGVSSEASSFRIYQIQLTLGYA